MTYSTRNRMCWIFLALAVLFLAAPASISALELNRAFSNDMVLQRDKPVNVWGTGKPGEKVTVQFANQEGAAEVDESGRWVVTLDSMPASREGRKMVVSSSIGNRKSEIGNLLVGDVFLFARQTSIDVSLGSTAEGKQAAGEYVTNDAYRFIHIKASPSRTLLNNLKKDATSGWQTADNKSALSMTAAAFYLGRDLVKDAKVPIGIVDLNMGYHFAAAWMSEKGLEKAAEDPEVEGAGDVTWYLEKKEGYYSAWDKRIVGYKGSESKKLKVSDKPLRGLSPIERPYFPTVCYNSVIHPLRGLAVKGMVLQLGNDYPYVPFTRLRTMGKITDLDELWTANGQNYLINKHGNRMTTTVLPAVIDDLRNSLGDATLPVGWIMPTGSDTFHCATHNRRVREFQRRIQLELKGVDLILPGAEHVSMSAQPAEETLLATRCKTWIAGTFYGAKEPAVGPLFDRVEFGKDTATVHFKSGTAEGLTAKGDALDRFEVAGGDREFVPCKAEIVGSTVKLTSDMAEEMTYVRFGWSDKPIQGLVNSAGLPALPFNTNSEWIYEWYIAPGEVDLPEEYYLPANKWPKRNYAIINCATEGKGFHLGPTGLWGTPAGPNLYVTEITPGSPADGQVQVGDMIYGVDGKEFGPEPDEKYVQFAAGVTKAEAQKDGGTMILNIRREGELIKVPIKLEFMGSFSATSPWVCEKSKQIVKKAEEYMRNGLRPQTGMPNDGIYMYGPWNDNVLFLLASGNPEMLGLVRRYIRRQMDALDASKRGEKDAYNSYGGWGNGYLAVLMGEYYHRTGDASVLPHLEYLVQMTQTHTPREWPPTEPSRYGMHPASQMPNAMGGVLAVEAGLKVDQSALNFDIRHLHDKRGENGFILYNGYGDFLPSDKQIPEPRRLDSVRKTKGMIGSMNGKLGTGAALFSLLDGYNKAVKNCSDPCVYAFNKTRTGHGGAWFNNFWTPIGAYHAGQEKYQHFMKGQQWWRELYRDHTGAVWQAHNAKGKESVLGVGFVIHRVAHYKLLRMFGAPKSAFGPNPPGYLKPALSAHRSRDYVKAETLIQALVKDGNIPPSDRPMVDYFLNSVQAVRKSVDYDLAYTKEMIDAGKYHLANLEYPQLKMVVAPEDARLQAIAKVLESKDAESKIASALKKAVAAQNVHSKAKKENQVDPFDGKSWEQVLAGIDTLVKDGYPYLGRKIGRKVRDYYKKFPQDQLNLWRLKIVESLSNAPEGWEKPGFDDSTWSQTTLTTVWRMAHTGLLRTSFDVKDKARYKNLYVRGNFYKQRNLVIYLNGHIVAKVSNVPRSGAVDFPLTSYALEILKNGKNTLAISAQHGERTVNFSFRLEANFKDKTAPKGAK